MSTSYESFLGIFDRGVSSLILTTVSDSANKEEENESCWLKLTTRHLDCLLTAHIYDDPWAAADSVAEEFHVSPPEVPLILQRRSRAERRTRGPAVIPPVRGSGELRTSRPTFYRQIPANVENNPQIKQE